jgi:hypothetical protein
MLRNWSHACYAFNFPANELQMALNGKVFEKIKDPDTSPGYKGQFGGHNILEETKDSKFFFSIGRYHFSDLRFVMKLAGVNAWNRTLNELELKSLSSCIQIPEVEIKGNILNDETKWKYPASPLVEETTFDKESFLCSERSMNKLVPMPIPRDSRDNMIDVCRRFGSDVNMDGTITSLENMEFIFDTIHSKDKFVQACCHVDDGRCNTFVPYFANASAVIVNDITGDVFDLGKEYYVNFWAGPEVNKTQPMGAYFGKLMSMKERLTSTAVAVNLNSCVMCEIPNSLETTAVVKLRGICKLVRAKCVRPAVST